MPETTKPIRLRDGSYQLPPFAILDEHEFVDEGTRKRQVFDKARLQKLANKLNDRVRQTGDLVPVTLGHTVDGLPEHKQPPIVGYSRNFRVAPLKNSGRWAIWADPIAHADHVETFRNHPRRSVELWAAKHAAGEDDIDPIAILGATSPRRDLGLHQFSRSGPSVRYLEPTDDRIHYRKETGDESMATEHEEGGSKLSPADVKAIVAELLQTEPLKKLLAVAEKMEAGGEEEMGPDGAAGAAPAGPAGAGGPEEYGPEREGEAHRENAGMGGEGYAAEGGRAARVPYTRGGRPRRQARPAATQVPDYNGDWRQWLADYEAMNGAGDGEQVEHIAEQVGRVSAEVHRYKRERDDMAKRLAALERENVALEINGTLADLAKDYVLDEEEEFKELIRLSKPQRDQRYEQIKRRYAKRADEVPGGGGEYVMGRDQEAVQPTRGGRRGEAQVNRYARTGEEASAIANEMARRGISDPEEFYRKIAEEQAGADQRAARNGPVRTR